ncbi:zinc finger protein 25 [Folsomia candida]|uniref:Zinc finger protein 26 n=1 Tax=Folsomia candida TaxID=158441 RepID=A0A226DSB6_FOLCA|nr:zinc finger protein 25 [Folsomia candida]OXA47567.1 Zinc finger protein 26 [Folsomia candida]
MDVKVAKKWDCSECSKSFKANKYLTKHMVTHDPDAKVKCEVCGTFSKNRIALSSHMRTFHSNRKRPSCDTCHRVFFDLRYLRKHIDTVHSTMDRPRFPCTFSGCEKTFLNKGYMAHHVKTEHAQNPARFPCKLCGKEFKTRSHLKQHIPSHTTEKPYNCATCGRGFAHKGQMKNHEMTHFGKSARDVSKCHLCPKTFLTRNGLQGHIRVVHENQRNYPCTFYDKRFSISSHLKRHVEAKHPANKELIHSCDKCEYMSHSKHNCAAHRMRHNAARQECYFCVKKFVTLNELVKHYRVHTLET